MKKFSLKTVNSKVIKMKKLIYLPFFAVLLVACEQSQEQKAGLLIKESLKTTLYKPETYKPIETKVDSAFAPYDDPAFYEELLKIEKMAEELENLEQKAKQAKKSMSIWEGPYQTSFGKIHYQEAKEEYEETNSMIEKLKARGKKQLEKVVAFFQEKPMFIGYKAFHNYRANNNAGNTLIGNNVFFIDKNFETVTYSMEVEEYNQMQDLIKQFKEELEEMGE